MSGIHQTFLSTGNMPVITDSRPAGSPSIFATAASQGETITLSTARTIVSVERISGETGSTCYIRAGTDYTTGILLASTPFVWNVATFYLSLSAGNYTVYTDSGGAVRNQAYFGTSYPQNRTNLNYIYAGWGNTTQRLSIENIKSY